MQGERRGEGGRWQPSPGQEAGRRGWKTQKPSRDGSEFTVPLGHPRARATKAPRQTVPDTLVVPSECWSSGRLRWVAVRTELRETRTPAMTETFKGFASSARV